MAYKRRALGPDRRGGIARVLALPEVIVHNTPSLQRMLIVDMAHEGETCYETAP